MALCAARGMTFCYSEFESLPSLDLMKCTHLIQGVQGGHPRKCHDDNSSRPSQVDHGTGKTYRQTQSCKQLQAGRHGVPCRTKLRSESRTEILGGLPSTPAPTIAVMLWNAAWTCNTLPAVSAQQALQMCPAGYRGIYNRTLTAGRESCVQN